MSSFSELSSFSSPQIVVFFDLRESAYRFTPGELISVGRNPSNRIPIPCDSVSQFHLEIRLERTGYVLFDLGSTNGTFVNGRPITACPLNEGDLISAGGGASLRFSIFESSQEDKKRLFDTAPVKLPR